MFRFGTRVPQGILVDPTKHILGNISRQREDGNSGGGTARFWDTRNGATMTPCRNEKCHKVFDSRYRRCAAIVTRGYEQPQARRSALLQGRPMNEEIINKP